MINWRAGRLSLEEHDFLSTERELHLKENLHLQPILIDTRLFLGQPGLTRL